MSYVPDIQRTLTGRYTLVEGIVHPRMMVEWRITSWDTNSGISDPDRYEWEVASNAHLRELKALPAKKRVYVKDRESTTLPKTHRYA